MQIGWLASFRGIDLDAREEMAGELGWQRTPDLIREIHEDDQDVQRDWPWNKSGLEPLDDLTGSSGMRWLAS